MSDAHCNNLTQRKALGLVTHDNTGGPFVVECHGCGVVYPSFQCNGGGQIADTGDYEDARCPHCGHVDPEECENPGLAWNTQQLKINELQQRLTAADERADVLEGALRTSLLAMKRIYQAGYDRIIEAGGTCDTPEYMMAHDPTTRELRALLAAKPETVAGHHPACRAVYDYKPGDCSHSCKPASQPQGEPVAWRYREGEGTQWRLTEMPPSTWYFDPRQYEVRNLYERLAPAAALPDGHCIMPRQLTAENGAKALLLGEFKLLVTKECPECCELEEPVEGCSICDGEGQYGQKHTIPWDQIKFIYSKAVVGLAVKTESAKS